MNIRNFIFFVLLSGILAPSAAQARWWGAGSKAVQSARVPLQAAVRRGVTRTLPRAGSNFSVSAAAVERYVLKPVSLTPLAKLKFNFDEAPYAWILETRGMYESTMQKFLSFKKELDVLLYYQARPSERRTLHPEEIAFWRRKMDELDGDLAALCWRVNGDDPALSAAMEYMTYAKWSLYPHAKDIYFTKPLPARTDRVFAAEEFFLHDPFPQPVKRWELASSRARRAAALLPSGLKVAVVNDMVFFREHLKELVRKGELFPGGELSAFSNAEELLDAARGGREFDVIFTDIIIGGAGGGGYYLASELRGRGYDGVIIALSSYREDVSLGREMFDRGLDGMITMDGELLYKRSWPANMMQKLANYYYYKRTGNWPR